MCQRFGTENQELINADACLRTRNGRLRVPAPESGAAWSTLEAVSEREMLEEFRQRLGEALRSSPARDLEKNLHALLGAFFARFELATREDLEVQKELIERAQAKLAALEARIAELEAKKR